MVALRHAITEYWTYFIVRSLRRQLVGLPPGIKIEFAQPKMNLKPPKARNLIAFLSASTVKEGFEEGFPTAKSKQTRTDTTPMLQCSKLQVLFIEIHPWDLDATSYPGMVVAPNLRFCCFHLFTYHTTTNRKAITLASHLLIITTDYAHVFAKKWSKVS